MNATVLNMVTFACMYFVNEIFPYKKLHLTSVIGNDAVNLKFGGAFLEELIAQSSDFIKIFPFTSPVSKTLAVSCVASIT